MAEDKEKKDKVESGQDHLNNNNFDTDIIDKQKQCRCCFQTIHISAKVCQHCGRHQNPWGGLWEYSYHILPVFIVIIAAIELTVAFKQQKDASNALEIAESDANAINRIKHEMVYHSTVLKAQGDDRQAFDRLREWSKDESYSFRLQAEQAWKRVLDDHAQPMYKSNFTVPWKEGVDPSSLTLSQLVSQYWIEPVQGKPALLEYIWRREDIAKDERLGFLADVLRRDTSLKACEYAGRYFTKGAGLKIKPLAIDYLVDWWEKNKDQFTN